MPTERGRRGGSADDDSLKRLADVEAREAAHRRTGVTTMAQCCQIYLPTGGANLPFAAAPSLGALPRS